MQKIAGIFVFLFWSLSATASWIAGSSITYRYIDTATYEVTLKTYRNCLSVAFDVPTDIYATCKKSSVKVQLKLKRVAIKDITPLCSSASKPCNPSNTYGTGYGFEEHVFNALVNFRDTAFSKISSCDEILFELSYCCRLSSINTSSNNTTHYNYAYLNRKLAEGNNSPQYLLSPNFSYALNTPVYYNGAAADTVEYDSISYEFDELLYSITSASTFVSGYSYKQPFAAYYPGSLKFPYSNPNANPPIGIYLGAETGDLVLTPTKNDVSAFVIMAKEWRKDSTGKWQVIGITRQELTASVSSRTGNHPPVFTGVSTYKLCEGDKLCFNITADDKVFVPPPPATAPPPDTTFITWNNGISKASFTITNPKDRLKTAQFCWTPDKSQISKIPYYFVAEVRDNNCNWSEVTKKAFKIYVGPRYEFATEITKQTCRYYSIKINSDTSLKGNFSSMFYLLDSNSKVSQLVQFNSTKSNYSANSADTFIVSKPGKYFAVTTFTSQPDGCLRTRIDTLLVKEAIPGLIAVTDTFYCAGSKLTLTADSTVLPEIKSFLWKTGNTSDTLSLLTLTPTADSFLIKLEAVDTMNCNLIDFVNIYRVDIPKPDLGNDTFICSNNSLVYYIPRLKNKFDKTVFSWSESNANDSLMISSPGTYWLKGQNVCGLKTDSLWVNNYKNLLAGVSPFVGCSGKPNTIYAQLGGYNYQWVDSTLGNKQTAQVLSAGVYSCIIKLTCGDTIIENVVYKTVKVPETILFDSAFFCEGNYLDLYPVKWDGSTTIQWNDNSTDSVKRIDKSGKYIVAATNICGVFYDTCVVTQRIKPQTNLGTDTLYCGPVARQYNFKNTDNTYQWSDNSTGPLFSITKPGTYWVRASNSCGSVTDSIIIGQSFKPVANLGADLFLSKPFSRVLDAQNPGASYQWSNNSTGQTITVSDFGVYWVKVSTPCGESSDTVTFYDLLTINQVTNKVHVFPNPADKIIYLELDASGGDLLNFNGIKILQFELKDGMLQADVSQLPQGIYLVKAFTSKGFFISKVLVWH